MAPEVSHGRGGAGNINPDDTPYVDGEVVRVGVEGSHDDGAFSTGRGGKTRPLFLPTHLQFSFSFTHLESRGNWARLRLSLAWSALS